MASEVPEVTGRGPTVQILDSSEEHNRACSMGMCHEHTFYLIRLRKGKEEAEVEITNPVYQARLDRTKGTRLGLKLDHHHSSLYVKEIIGGLAFAWNTSHVDQKIRPGDFIVKVNNVEGDATLLMDECKKSHVLEIELHRSNAPQISSGLHATVKQAFDNLEPGFTATVQRVDEEGDALMKIAGIGNQWVCKSDYSKFIFEDSERFYFKRYCDFHELHKQLQGKITAGTAEVVKTLPPLPQEERFGFRRMLSSVGVSSFMQERKVGLQKCLNVVCQQLTRIEAEPVLAEFFGADPVPDVDATTKEALKGKLELMISKYRAMDGETAA